MQCLEKEEVSSEYYECKSEFSSLGENVFLVSKCPELLSDSFIGWRCLDPSFNMHVYDQSGVNFYNIYCALCHNRSLQDVEPWSTKQTSLFSSCSKLKFSDGIRMSLGAKLRRCNIAIETCPWNTNMSGSTVQGCAKYFYPFCMRVELGNNLIFKNPFCAHCHLESDQYLASCNEENRKVDIRMWQFRSKEIKYANPSHMCLPDEVQDPQTLVCRPLSCTTGYVLRDRKCVADNGTTTTDVLNNWNCFTEHVLFFFRGDITALNCVQSELRQKSSFGGLVPDGFAQDIDGGTWLAVSSRDSHQ